MKKVNISVCICSRYFNNNLMKLLESLKKNKNKRYFLKIVIIFNNLKKIESREIKKIHKIYKPSLIKILYEKKIGVSYARNKFLNYIKNKNTDFCCFLDDDCVVKKNYFLNYIKIVDKEDCNIFTGPQVYKSKNYFFRYLERNYLDGSVVKWASTNNVFFRKNILSKNIFFSTKVTKYGFGEDQLFFSKYSQFGEKIKWFNNKVYELRQKNRENIKWFLSRNYYYGLTGFLIDKELHGILACIPVNIVKSLYYLIKMFINVVFIFINPKKNLILSITNFLRFFGRIVSLKNII
tara:strand:- start:151 stop:1029 length:879 start_codon:yes stop_codon:yes gene_type:complete